MQLLEAAYHNELPRIKKLLSRGVSATPRERERLSRNLRSKDLLGPVTRVTKKKKKRERERERQKS